MTAPWSIVLLPLGGVAMGARPWCVVRSGGEMGPLHVTVVLKASVAFDGDERASLGEPAHVVDAVGRADDDLAPYLPRAEVWLAAGAASVPVSSPAAHLSVARGSWVLLEQALGPDGEAAPISAKQAASTAPGYAQPAPQAGALAAWMRGIGSASRAPEAPSEIMCISAAVDWTEFQCTEKAMQCRYLTGDETVALRGIGAASLRWKLPEMRASARVFGDGVGADGQPVALVCDGWEIDVVRRRCTLRWRGAFPVASPAALSSVEVAGAVAVRQSEFDWSALKGEPEAVTVPFRAAERPELAAVEGEGFPLTGRARERVISSAEGERMREELGLPAQAASRERAREAASRLAMSDTDAELVRARLGIPGGRASSKGRAAIADPAPPPAVKAAPANRARVERTWNVEGRSGELDRTRPGGGVPVGVDTVLGARAPDIPLRPAPLEGAPWMSDDGGEDGST